MSSSYHPQTYGQTEVTNGTIEQYLRAFVHHKPSLWHRFLPWVEYHYNTSFHSYAGMTPYEVVYGKLPPSIPSYVIGTSELAASDELVSSQEAVLDLLKNNLAKAQQQVLVQWTGLAPEKASWEVWQMMQQVYNLEDKVEFGGVDIGTDADQGSGISKLQPTIINDVRPIRVRKLPSKFKNHIVYK
ncbi:unnamed protein product [Vicia faba]|uniref:Integrase catalytic domain-containing protein n=1 Tax=Vicia faba TaxID=3906 RepID=A0AAV0Z8W9_VICFA|nr:unnamed protein product [Vicia faba]